MNRRLRVLILIGTVAMSVLTLAGAFGPSDESLADSSVAGAGDGEPVLVELFTSQGCSSCPPADRLLSRLAGEDDVIPLAYHVDYWNYIGWQDPFSKSAWSERQRSYARSLGHGRVYTPQLVVDGASDCVGSDADAVERQIAEARRRGSRARLTLDLSAGAGSSRIQADLKATVSPGSPLELKAAIFENGLETAVSRGENARRTLHNDFVVRRLERWGTLEAGATSWSSGRREIVLEPEWNVDRLGVAVFAQDPERRTIHGAAVASLVED